MKNFENLSPPVKWVGGKRQLLDTIRQFIPDKISTYYEPFVGGGAVLFDLKPKKAVINDLNKELVNMYNVVKNNVDELIDDLKKHKNESDYFYSVRELDRDKSIYRSLTNVEKASRVLYLNKTCYNGLYRVNKAGQFNTPFGRYKNPNIVNEETLRAVNEYFNWANIKILSCDFEKSLKYIRKGAFVYFDPPYHPISDSSNFTGYAAGGFSEEDQVRLKKTCDKLNARGVKFLLSNSSADFILDLYKNYKIEMVKANRTINSVAENRGEVDEVLVRNYG